MLSNVWLNYRNQCFRLIFIHVQFHSFIYLFIYSSIHLFVRSFFCSFVPSFACLFARLFVRSILRLSVRMSGSLFVRPSDHVFVHSFVCSFFQVIFTRGYVSVQVCVNITGTAFRHQLSCVVVWLRLETKLNGTSLTSSPALRYDRQS